LFSQQNIHLLEEKNQMTAVAQTAENKYYPWWLVLLQGIAAIVIGLLLIAQPYGTLAFLVLFLGIYWFISGIFSIISIFLDHTMWGWKLFTGILGIIAGLIVMQHPLWSSILVPATLVIILGIEGIIIGCVNLFAAFKGSGWGVGILGVLSIIFGILLLLNPLVATLVVPFVLGGLGVVGGVIAIYMAFRLK
jgi:uncharacterized membrane protein HdeD (DUF308 family)